MTYVCERKEGKNQLSGLFSSIPYVEVENSVLFISVVLGFFLEIIESIMEGGWNSLPDWIFLKCLSIFFCLCANQHLLCICLLNLASSAL